MMTIDRRYCCRTVLAEPHESDCEIAAKFAPPVLAAVETVDRWTPQHKESALRYLAGRSPAMIAELDEFVTNR